MRLGVYGGVSTAMAMWAIVRAFRQRSNFYAASVYLSKSNACMMILANFGVFMTIILGKTLQLLLFGSLRMIEVERMHDRLWFTITETLLALAMFREDFDASFVIMFISLIFVKCFHWLAADRVEWMEQMATPPSKIFHFRMVASLTTIVVTDLLFILYSTESMLLDGPTVVLMFAMEYLVLFISCLSIIAKYCINVYALRLAHVHHAAMGIDPTDPNAEAPEPYHWEAKSSYIFYVELASDFWRLVTYLTFLSLTLTYYGLPINVLRETYTTARSFFTRCHNLAKFHQATRNMDELYPNATREELENMSDRTCIICRDDLEFREPTPLTGANANGGQATTPAGAQQAARPRTGPNDTPKKLPCGHIFHFHCLRSWLERQQTCPTCRRPVIQSDATTSNPTEVAAARPGGVPRPEPRAAPTPNATATPAPNAGPSASGASSSQTAGPSSGPTPTPTTSGLFDDLLEERRKRREAQAGQSGIGAPTPAGPSQKNKSNTRSSTGIAAGRSRLFGVEGSFQPATVENNPLLAFSMAMPSVGDGGKKTASVGKEIDVKGKGKSVDNEEEQTPEANADVEVKTEPMPSVFKGPRGPDYPQLIPLFGDSRQPIDARLLFPDAFKSFNFESRPSMTPDTFSTTTIPEEGDEQQQQQSMEHDAEVDEEEVRQRLQEQLRVAVSVQVRLSQCVDDLHRALGATRQRSQTVTAKDKGKGKVNMFRM